MATVQPGARLALQNVLYLTDFSEPSEAVLPFASAIAREYGSKIYAYHVMIPSSYAYMTPDIAMDSINAQEEVAETELKRIGSQLSGLQHECIMERGTGVWRSLEEFVESHAVDLIVLGTHGRTGSEKLLLGSVAEEVFRRSQVPVLTVGPWAYRDTHRGARFHTVLFASDFSPESLAAAPYAFSMAQENQAPLILLYVIKPSKGTLTDLGQQGAESEAVSRLLRLIPAGAEAWCRPEAIVRTGNPADEILAAARERHADLIVLGLHDHGEHLGAATHLGRTTAHKIVSHATCPVLTVRR
jgi:nucleotide-binding universal stress UspA family protein